MNKLKGRNLVAKAKLAKLIVEENLYYEFKKELIFMKEFKAGNWSPDESKLAEPISKMEMLKLIVDLDEFTIETLTVFGIMPYIGVSGQV